MNPPSPLPTRFSLPFHTHQFQPCFCLGATTANPPRPAQLPLGLLNAAQGHPILVELKNGENLNGHLVMCDTWMNLTLKEVVQSSPVGPPRSRRFPGHGLVFAGVC